MALQLEIPLTSILSSRGIFSMVNLSNKTENQVSNVKSESIDGICYSHVRIQSRWGSTSSTRKIRILQSTLKSRAETSPKRSYCNNQELLSSRAAVPKCILFLFAKSDDRKEQPLSFHSDISPCQENQPLSCCAGSTYALCLVNRAGWTQMLLLRAWTQF